MSESWSPRGFEEGRAGLPHGRLDRPVLPFGALSHTSNRARLARVVRRAPEVMVKITGKTRDANHLKAHLTYISRKGSLTLEGSEGERLIGLEDVRERASDWAAEDGRKRAGASMSVSVMLSMPAGTSATAVRDAARQFAVETFGGRHEYVMALHTDVDHPHVHLAVRSRGEDGKRLNPRKADLAQWRETFARTLRDRGIEAEATPRRLRGVVRRSEKLPFRKLRERAEREGTAAPGAGQQAASWAPSGWEDQIAIRRAYLQAARDLAEVDESLARATLEFVRQMPGPLTKAAPEKLADQIRSREEPGRSL